jgi:uncharacterized membrane protein YhaH (DUF805 family)
MLRHHARRLEALSMWLMVIGIAALCQPWSLVLHTYSVTIIIVALIMFNIFSRIKSPQRSGPAASGTAAD